MLSPGASNALLKSLEEPPSHVVFILCTTDPQKVLPTIRSRTQHFEFHLLDADELADHVRYVIADAELGLGDDAVDHVVRLGGGSARDTLSALDQVSAMGGVVEQAQPVEAILDALSAHDAGAALVAVAEATAAGRDARTLGETLIARLRDAFLAVMKAPDRHLPAADLAKAEELGAQLGAAGLTRALEVLGEALVELAKKPDPRIVLEVALVRLCRPDADRSFDAIIERLERLERAQTAPPTAPPADGGSAPIAPATARGGPADAARQELAKAGTSRAARAPVKKATSAPKAARARTETTDAVDEAVGDDAVDQPRTAAPAPAAGIPTADELQAAWPTVAEGLKGGSRGMFRDGHFHVEGEQVVLTVPKGPPVGMLEQRRRLLEQAQQMMAAQQAASEREIEGVAGGGVVRVRTTGTGQVLGVSIDPEVVDPNDVALLEDLVVAALHDMNAQLLEIQREAMGPLAGLGDIFGAS
jgi:DNA polymerase-3 subunit gamma/tau